jgi:hypothetical protein
MITLITATFVAGLALTSPMTVETPPHTIVVSMSVSGFAGVQAPVS